MMFRYALLLSTLSVGTSAFTIAYKPTIASTKLFLKPSEGSQLAAAWEASCFKHDDESSAAESTSPPPTNITPVTSASAARAFVSRVFSLPSTLRHPNQDGKDVVYYPIVGFQLYSDHEGHCTVLPTTSRASCRIPAAQTELLVGWYSSACFLEPDDDSVSAKI